MAQALSKLITVQQFLKSLPENGRYELHNGSVVQMSQPIGKLLCILNAQQQVKSQSKAIASLR